MRLAENVPQRDVDCRIASGLCPCGAPAQIVFREHAIDGLDLQRIAPQQLRGHGFMQIGLYSLRTQKSLPEPDEAFIGMEPQEDQIAEFLQADRLKRRYLHDGFCLRLEEEEALPHQDVHPGLARGFLRCKSFRREVGGWTRIGNEMTEGVDAAYQHRTIA